MQPVPYGPNQGHQGPLQLSVVCLHWQAALGLTDALVPTSPVSLPIVSLPLCYVPRREPMALPCGMHCLSQAHAAMTGAVWNGRGPPVCPASPASPLIWLPMKL
jgi:hypothetical protein